MTLHPPAAERVPFGTVLVASSSYGVPALSIEPISAKKLLGGLETFIKMEAGRPMGGHLEGLWGRSVLELLSGSPPGAFGEAWKVL